MEKIKIKIDFNDSDYSKALSKALLLNSERFVLSEDTPDLTLDETNTPLYLPVQEIIKLTMAKMNCPLGLDKPPGATLYTGFTSGIGGGGLTSTALCYAKIKSRIFKTNIAFISFDPIFRQSFTDEGFGISFINSLSNASFAEELVLDIPYGIEGYRDILDMCERRIIVTGFNEDRSLPSEILFDELVDSSSTYINAPKNYIFNNHYENSVNTSDIHSQLGKEVLSLARKLDE